MEITMRADAIEYRESGAGPTVVLAPGSCSTGSAWRPILANLGDVRAITTSLPGYGATAERRTAEDRSIAPVAEALEDVIRRTGQPVHLVGHSFGGLAALAVALRGQVPLLSLTILEAPAAGVLHGPDERAHLAAVRAMTDSYFEAHRSGRPDAIAIMIDFYGGAGTWAAMPDAVRTYAASTTAVNLLDWESAYGFKPDETIMASLAGLRTCVAVGENSHPAIVRANALLAGRLKGAEFVTIRGAAHFMITTHPAAVAALIMDQANKAAGVKARQQR
jgi:pimeloyl-ACP methyl ester carboxylesterase